MDVEYNNLYIYGQAEHHKKQTFVEGYDNFIIFYQQTLSENQK